jgi:peptidoglycan biosynthesis protein MviN/MurJ (putative lipid II flippase)
MIWGAYCAPCIFLNVSSVLPLVNEANNGPIAAAMLAAGIGCFVLGLMICLAQGSKAIGGILNFYNPVGPLSGKTIVAVVAWLVAWGVLGSTWKDQSADFGKIYKVTLILVVLGLLGSFPLFFDLFGH